MGNRLEYLRKAEELLIQNYIQVLDESSIYETEPWGKSEQPWFLNVVIQVETGKNATELLECLLEIERAMGRERKEKWGERCIDIDILYYRNEVIDTPSLTIPHPGIPDRKFTLIPLVEMIPIEQHPLLQKNQMELLSECSDPLDCRLTDYKL
ncbi:MAG: 2-amino-4-hydroxy-6-hydroxymethyldihydropteridine diphosphokinase [Ekhidna sp.]